MSGISGHHRWSLLKLFDAHADSVLSGHLHLTGVVRRNGVHHIQGEPGGANAGDGPGPQAIGRPARNRVAWVFSPDGAKLLYALVAPGGRVGLPAARVIRANRQVSASGGPAALEWLLVRR